MAAFKYDDAVKYKFKYLYEVINNIESSKKISVAVKKNLYQEQLLESTKKALTNAFKEVSPSLFFGNDKWSGTTKAQYKIKLSEANLNQIAKNVKIPQSQIKPAAGKKTTTFTVNGYVIGLETSKKTGTSSDAASTRKFPSESTQKDWLVDRRKPREHPQEPLI